MPRPLSYHPSSTPHSNHRLLHYLLFLVGGVPLARPPSTDQRSVTTQTERKTAERSSELKTLGHMLTGTNTLGVCHQICQKPCSTFSFRSEIWTQMAAGQNFRLTSGLWRQSRSEKLIWTQHSGVSGCQETDVGSRYPAFLMFGSVERYRNELQEKHSELR